MRFFFHLFYFFSIIEAMEDLTKTQIVLLTLFTSFVTSIATGIVTVALMQQAPEGVTQTIDHVIQKTIQTVVQPQQAQATVVKEQVVVKKEDDAVEGAINKNEKSIITLSAVGADGALSPLGIGTILSKDGIFVTDGAYSDTPVNDLRATYAGNTYSVAPIVGTASSTTATDTSIAFFRVASSSVRDTATSTTDAATTTHTQVSSDPTFTPAILGSSQSLSLGETAITLSGYDGTNASVGIISHLDTAPAASSTLVQRIETSATVAKGGSGGPLVTLDGNVSGINIVASDGTQYAVPADQVARTLIALGGSIMASTSPARADSASPVQKLIDSLAQTFNISGSATSSSAQ